MKNYISYFYNMVIEDIFFINQQYIFNSGQQRYAFKKCNNSNIELYGMELKNQLINYHHFYKIIPNRYNNIITIVDNIKYILLLIDNDADNRINYADLTSQFYTSNEDMLATINHFPWPKFWKQKIDYMEEWFELKKEKYKNIYPWFYLFVGISENALMYVQNVEMEEKIKECDRLCFQHNRIGRNTTKYEYYDPTTLIIDHSSRDIGEYIKFSVIDETFNIEEFMEYLARCNFSIYWLRMLYARILFPSFFFDYMEKIMNKSNDDEKNDNDEQLKFEKSIVVILENLQKISNSLKDKYHIPIINWIIKKT